MIRAHLTLRIHAGRIVATVSDGEGVTLHSEPEDVPPRPTGEVGVGPDGEADATEDTEREGE